MRKIRKSNRLLVSMTCNAKFNRNLDSQWEIGAKAFLLLKTGTNAKRWKRNFPVSWKEKRQRNEEQQMYLPCFLSPFVLYTCIAQECNKTGNMATFIFSPLVAVSFCSSPASIS
jgi:hypothetical protein